MAEGLGLSLSAFPSFDTQTDPTSIGPRLRKWMLRFENRTKAINLTDPDRKLALLLDYAGSDVPGDYLTITPATDGNNLPPKDIYIFAISRNAEQPLLATSADRVRNLQLPISQAGRKRNSRPIRDPLTQAWKDMRFYQPLS